MTVDAAEARAPERCPPSVLAAYLARLYDEQFGGASSGKFRISRKFLRQLAARRKLSDEFLGGLAEELFEAGFVFVDCESYFVVFSQKQFSSYRRVTSVAVNKVLSNAQSRNEQIVEGDEEAARSDAEKIEKTPTRRRPNFH